MGRLRIKKHLSGKQRRQRDWERATWPTQEQIQRAAYNMVRDMGAAQREQWAANAELVRLKAAN